MGMLLVAVGGLVWGEICVGVFTKVPFATRAAKLGAVASTPVGLFWDGLVSAGARTPKRPLLTTVPGTAVEVA